MPLCLGLQISLYHLNEKSAEIQCISNEFSGADEITVIEILKYLFQNEKETEIQHVPSKFLFKVILKILCHRINRCVTVS